MRSREQLWGRIGHGDHQMVCLTCLVSRQAGRYRGGVGWGVGRQGCDAEARGTGFHSWLDHSYPCDLGQGRWPLCASVPPLYHGGGHQHLRLSVVHAGGLTELLQAEHRVLCGLLSLPLINAHMGCPSRLVLAGPQSQLILGGTDGTLNSPPSLFSRAAVQKAASGTACSLAQGNGFHMAVPQCLRRRLV